MINDCLSGKIDYIITKSVSRFARNTVDCLDHVRILKAKGIGVFFEEQNIDTLKIDSELYLVIYAGFAQSESESMSKNITWTFRKKFEDGNSVFMYKKLLGYKKGEDGMPEIVPEEAALVKRVYNMYLAGETPRRISAAMKAEKIEIPGKSLSFSESMISGILTNEKYCGDSVLQKTVTIDCISKTRRKNTGEAPMYYVQNSHPAIISREVFHKTQEELMRRKTRTPQSSKSSITATGKYSRFALTDVLVCAECGSRYKRVTWTASGQKKIVWRCINRLDYGKKYCKTSPTVDEIKLHSAIMRALNQFNEEDRSTYMALMKATIGEALGLNGCSDEIDLLQRKIDALNKKMIELINDSVQSGDDMESREAEFKEISDTIALLKSRIATVEDSANTSGSTNERLEQIQKIIAQREQKRFEYDDSIVRQMIECIKVLPEGKLEIIFGGGYVVEESLDA